MLNVIEKEGLFKRDFNLISNVFIFKKEMHSGLLKIFVFKSCWGSGRVRVRGVGGCCGNVLQDFSKVMPFI